MGLLAAVDLMDLHFLAFVFLCALAYGFVLVGAHRLGWLLGRFRLNVGITWTREVKLNNLLCSRILEDICSKTFKISTETFKSCSD